MSLVTSGTTLIHSIPVLVDQVVNEVVLCSNNFFLYMTICNENVNPARCHYLLQTKFEQKLPNMNFMKSSRALNERRPGHRFTWLILQLEMFLVSNHVILTF